eukprot:CAMPEP_0119511280 /NCGR_PEP_ID=MMETSP1344-20130328/29977_1 /TAXON_ID=236787 /ORGANISM="Florenciella parvula, Strain CCMP2471" /LENGTH=301 /DNA_ID=CAMNT_0007548269 /DNA_START=44 /DNA_END=950 /DNA_ORIENTATION=+
MADEMSALDLKSSYTTFAGPNDGSAPVDAELTAAVAREEDYRVMRSLPKFGIGLVAVAMFVALTGTGGAKTNLPASTRESLVSEHSATCSACEGLTKQDCLFALGEAFKGLDADRQAELSTTYEFPTSKAEFSTTELLKSLFSVCTWEVDLDMTSTKALTLVDSYTKASIVKAEATLEGFDEDSSGGISLREWTAVYEAAGKDYNVADFRAYMEAHDSNGDGEISATEAMSAVTIDDQPSVQTTDIRSFEAAVADQDARKLTSYDTDAAPGAAGASSSSALRSRVGGMTAPTTFAASARAV